MRNDSFGFRRLFAFRRVFYAFNAIRRNANLFFFFYFFFVFIKQENKINRKQNNAEYERHIGNVKTAEYIFSENSQAQKISDFAKCHSVHKVAERAAYYHSQSDSNNQIALAENP